MTVVPILRAERHWVCPSCTETQVTYEANTVGLLHNCRGRKLLTVPLVQEGTRVDIVVHPLEDYIGDKLIRLDAEHRPVTHVTTVRDDGQDATVYPAPAVIHAKDYL